MYNDEFRVAFVKSYLYSLWYFLDQTMHVAIMKDNIFPKQSLKAPLKKMKCIS